VCPSVSEWKTKIGYWPLTRPVGDAVDGQVDDREFAEVPAGEGFILLPQPLGHLADRRTTQHAGPARIPKRHLDVPRAQCQRSPNNPHRWSLKSPHPPHEGGHRHDGEIWLDWTLILWLNEFEATANSPRSP
jgi:hypothetical protein